MYNTYVSKIYKEVVLDYLNIILEQTMRIFTPRMVAAMLSTLLFSTASYAQDKNPNRLERISGNHSIEQSSNDEIVKLNGHNVYKGIVRVKFKNQPQITERLDNILQRQGNSQGVVSRAGAEKNLTVDGFDQLNSLNSRFNAVQMKRVFRPAGKFEARHREWGLHLWYEVEVGEGMNLSEVLAAYGQIEDIQTVEPRYEMKLQTLPGAPNDPQYGTQSSHYDLINTVQAWGIESGSSDVVVAIEDQGVDYTHPDLAGHMWTNTGETPGDGIDNDNNGYVDDYYGYNFGDNSGDIAIDYHGTHVGGTVSAETNNGVGVSGIAGGSGSNDGVRLMSLSVFGSRSNGGFDEAFIYAADNGAAISQNSWGGGAQSTALENAIDYFIANGGGNVMNGGLAVFAAGNDNSSSTSIGYPGSYAPVIAVASTTHSGVKSSFSNYGSWVDIAAPGSNILSTYPVSQGSYNTISGTSMACPHVSGVAALVLSNKHRNGETLTATQLRDILESTANASLLYDNNSGYAGQLGSGMLDAYAALTGEVAPPPPPPACTANYVTDVTLSLTTDNYGSETSWTLKDNLNNTVVASGSGYANNASYTETFQLSTGGNYTFTINDAYGDGICCAYGNGSYTLVDGANATISSGGDYGSGESVTFCIEDGGTPPPAGNNAPVANAGGSYTTTLGDAITFDASASSDADGDALTYAWDFGDGNTGSGVAPSHTYAAAGSYTATVTVSDGTDSNTASASVTVEVPTSDAAMTSTINISTRNQGPWTRAQATITVTSNGSPVSGASVNMSWSGRYSATLNATTNASGQIYIESERFKGSPSFTLTINSISAAGYVWDTANSDVSASVGTASVNNFNTVTEVVVYPNPVTKGTLNINTGAKESTIAIYSAAGQLVYSKNITDSNVSIDASNFNKGLYFVKIQTENGVRNAKVLIK